MSDLFSVEIPRSLYQLNAAVFFTDSEIILNSDMHDWLCERGKKDEDWSVDHTMTIRIGHFERIAFITFVDDATALEFKLRWL